LEHQWVWQWSAAWESSGALRPVLGLAWRTFDFSASLIWATSGALLAARRGYDMTGIFAVALVSSTGGGLLRDGLFLQEGPPALVRTPAYLVIAGVATLSVFAFGKRLDDHRLLSRTLMADAVGLGVFAVVGMHLALRANLNLPAVVFVGVVNAIGGGILRSLFLHETPEVFRPGEFTALAAFIGCVVYVVLARLLALDDRLCAGVSVAATALLRILSVRYRLKTIGARGFDLVDGR
jgi:uncharacterized membrane protein YeiH